MSSPLISIILMLALAVCPPVSEGESADTLRIREMDEVVVQTTAKENVPLALQPVSYSSLSKVKLREGNVHGIKDLTGLVPGLFIPTYGSRLTSSIYLRGVGSRINTPAVGLYVDGVPWIDKSAYDFALGDVERIDVLRGPQSTLYGRNTMGGLIRIHTHDPLEYTGSDISLGAAMYNDYRVRATHYHRVSDRFGFSGAVGYNHHGGYFRNEGRDGERADRDDDLNVRLRAVGLPSDHVRLDGQMHYEYSRQGAYPYEMVGWSSSEAREADPYRTALEPTLGKISYNRHSHYGRHLLNLGLKAEHTWDRVILTNALAYQLLRDDMLMDQDFTARDIYTLEQRQRTSILSEEIALKSRPGAWRHWQWTTGAGGFHQWLHTDAPVHFRQDGLSWVSSMINAQASGHLPQITTGPMTMDFLFSDQLQGDNIAFQGNYSTPTLSGALFHQSTITDMFGVRGLELTLGLHLDCERMRLSYRSWYDFVHVYSLSGHLSSPFLNKDIAMVPEAAYQASTDINGRLSHHYLQLLPRASVLYRLPQCGHVYATVSRGYRSGGYNIQMFSELLQAQMRTDIMQDVADATIPVLQSQPMVPGPTRDQVTALLQGMAQQPALDVDALCLYRPEYAWNYEVGTHLTLAGGRLSLDASLYMTDINDQQLSRMAASGLGRITVNAGRSRSLGAELSLQTQITDALSLHANYGYTHSTFRDYATLDAAGNEVNYQGRFVPFVPQHTLDIGARYQWLTRGWVHRVALSAGWHGVGRIYWDEENAHSQHFYGTLDSRLTLTHGNVDLSMWGTNLTAQRYQAFYFQSMSRCFAQRGRPLQCGVQVRWRF